MDKLTIGALDSLFNYLNNPEQVFWIRDKSYRKQIYISPSFETVWGIPTARLYEDPQGDCLKSSLIQDDGKDRWIALNERKKAFARNQSNNTTDRPASGELLLRMKGTDGQERYLLDRNYLLLDDKGQHLGFAGIVQPVSRDEWYAMYYAEKSKSQFDSNNALKKHIFDSLHKEAGLIAITNNNTQHQQKIPMYFVTIDNKDILFTERESECIHYTKQGKSAKQIADICSISPRTVEFHLSNACLKANCRTKLALLSETKIKSS